MKITKTLGLLPLAAVIALAACKQQTPSVTEASPDAASATASAPAGASSATVTLAPTAGKTAQGALKFEPADGGVKVSGSLSGLKPGAEHGFHVHEKGDCSAPDASSAGGHLNPDQQPHGNSAQGPHHAGDAPNLKADDTGNAEVSVMIEGLEVGTGGPKDVVGKAVVVHEGPDDYQSQPAGNSGSRIACGVINGG